jgi:Tfp pilus assembly protein PilN
MRAVNLLPANAYAPKQRLPHAPVVLAAAVPVLAGALVYLGYSFEHANASDKQTAYGVLQAEIAALAPPPQIAAEAAQVSSLRVTREAALQDALGKRVSWEITFDRLARIMPSGSWLTSLNATSPTPSSSTSTTSAASPTGFSVQGYAKSQETVAQVLARLALVPGLSNVALASTSSTSAGRLQVVQFNVTAQVGS